MDDIRINIDVGIDTILQIDLSELNFTGVQEVIFTIKNLVTLAAPPIVERKFTAAKVYDIIITAEESARLQHGAQYDFQKILIDGTRIKLTENGTVNLRKAVGEKID